MELLEGEDLRRRAPLSWRETCQYLRDIATCLSLLHARRLIHRDVSPGNVKLTGDGHCKLIDFGALTEFGKVDYIVGTPPFIAPEMLHFGRLDQRVDLYALGALGYYCLTGRHAYPARRIEALPEALRTPPASPAQLDPQIPGELSELVMALLHKDPLARPATASEVIARLDFIGDLPPEEPAAQRLLMQSYLAAPRYVGRTRELARFQAAITSARDGQGAALRIAAQEGTGRTRLLEEIEVRTQLAGAAAVFVDASAQHGPYASLRAAAHALLDAAPEAARTSARAHQKGLAAVDASLAVRLVEPLESASDSDAAAAQRSALLAAFAAKRGGSNPPAPGAPGSDEQERGQALSQWLLETSRQRPLVLLIDNVEYADDASLSVLVALAREAPKQRIVLVVVEPDAPVEARALGVNLLRAQCEAVPLAPLTHSEMAALIRSLFADAPRAERLSDWLFDLTSGSPLHCMGLVRELIAQGLIRHENGVWALPSDRPTTLASSALDEALAKRLSSLSPSAFELAECLSLARVDVRLDLVRRLGLPEATLDAQVLLEELVASNVLQRDQQRVTFTSAALRQCVLKGMSPPARRRAHLILGRALTEVLSDDDPTLQLEAGWHLIRGGEEMRGADMIAAVTHDPIACGVHAANLLRLGTPVEAALKVYRAARKSRRERMPLLTALTLAGYYEHYRFANTYADDALCWRTPSCRCT